MDEFLSHRHAAEAVMFMVGFIAAAVAAIGCTIAVQWRKARQAEADAVLKQEMLRRGMSADEIVQVLQAGQANESPRRHCQIADSR